MVAVITPLFDGLRAQVSYDRYEDVAEATEEMHEAWVRYSEVLREIGIVPSWEHKLTFCAGWYREGLS